MDETTTGNFEIFVKGKGEQYLVHSKMAKNMKCLDEEPTEHHDLVRKAIADIIAGKEPELPPSRGTGRPPRSKDQIAADAEARRLEMEEAKQKNEEERQRKRMTLARSKSMLGAQAPQPEAQAPQPEAVQEVAAEPAKEPPMKKVPTSKAKAKPQTEITKKKSMPKKSQTSEAKPKPESTTNDRTKLQVTIPDALVETIPDAPAEVQNVATQASQQEAIRRAQHDRALAAGNSVEVPKPEAQAPEPGATAEPVREFTFSEDSPEAVSKGSSPKSAAADAGALAATLRIETKIEAEGSHHGDDCAQQERVMTRPDAACAQKECVTPPEAASALARGASPGQEQGIHTTASPSGFFAGFFATLLAPTSCVACRAAPGRKFDDGEDAPLQIVDG